MTPPTPTDARRDAVAASDDTLERLRGLQEATEAGRPFRYVKDIFKCAADEIEHLRALSISDPCSEAERVREALAPFAKVGILVERLQGQYPDGAPFKSGCAWEENNVKKTLTWGDFRRAREAYSAIPLSPREPGAGSGPEAVAIGCNHLANVLIGRLGGGFSTTYPPTMKPLDALELIGAGDTYDVWCCWAAIMSTRDAAIPARGEADAGDGNFSLRVLADTLAVSETWLKKTIDSYHLARFGGDPGMVIDHLREALRKAIETDLMKENADAWNQIRALQKRTDDQSARIAQLEAQLAAKDEAFHAILEVEVNFRQLVPLAPIWDIARASLQPRSETP